MPTIRIAGAENVKKVLQMEHMNIVSFWPKSTRKLLGTSALSMAIGETHSKRRKIVSRAFSRSALERYVPIMHQKVQETVKELYEQSFVDLSQELELLTLTVAFRLLAGVDFTRDQMKCHIQLFHDFMDGFFTVPVYIPGSRFYKASINIYIL